MVGQFDFLLPGQPIRELMLLAEIEDDPTISQCRMAARVGLAPSMVNNYIRRLVARGCLVKCGANNRSTTYHLTAAGRERREDLVRRYTIETVRFYKYAKHEFRRILAGKFGARRDLRIALYGAAETGELVCQLCLEMGHRVVGVFDSDSQRHGGWMFGLTVEHPAGLTTLDCDLVLITSLGHADEIAGALEPLRRIGREVFKVG
ncbi:MAG: winged helix-turn-helix transcriptional regulator [Chloroflexi bacterium]|nr:MAG: winged helix-turn-helix transcriptional regulator [Chloroflexota bacterium]